MTEYLCLCEPHAAQSFHSQKKKWSKVLLVSSEPDSHNTNNSFPSMIGAQKAARSHWDSLQYCMTTRRRSWWQASSGSTAAESSSLPPGCQAWSLRPSWAELLLTTSHTARQHRRGGWWRVLEHERHHGCLGSTEEKVHLISSEEREDPLQLLISDWCHWKRDQLILRINI